MTDRAEVTVTKLVGGGRGLAHHEDRVWLISGALPGEEVLARCTGSRRGIVEGCVDEVLRSPSPHRDPDPCPHAPVCGGCDWPHVFPEPGGALKREVAAEAARGHVEIRDRLRTAPVLTSPNAYRLRARLHWDPDSRSLGFYRRQSHQVGAIPECRIVSPRLIRSLETLERGLSASCPVPADVEWLENLDGTQAVAALRARPRGPELRPDLVPGRSDPGAGADGFHLLMPTGSLRRCWGRDHVRMDLPIPLTVPIGAFFQGNRHLVPELFDRVSRLIGPAPDPTWDLHAGVGFLAAAAMHAGPRPLTLVESMRHAARAATVNLPDAAVQVGQTAESVLRRSGRLPRTSLVLTDPPRSGMTTELRRRLAGWHPDRILMLGCDPATWARDAADLLSKGYHLSHLELIDLFPSTHHVEILAVLETDG